MPARPIFVHGRTAAATLGIPYTWLEEEAEHGRLPHVQAGRSRLYNVEAVAAALLNRPYLTARGTVDAPGCAPVAAGGASPPSSAWSATVDLRGGGAL
jgi:hypothetical protein